MREAVDQAPTAGREDLGANLNAHRSPEWRPEQEVAHMPYGVRVLAQNIRFLHHQ